jgi:hypothetical protein
MVEALVMLFLFLMKLLTDDDEKVQSLEDSLAEDGYDWGDVGTVLGEFGDSLVDATPDVLSTLGTASVLKETGGLSIIGVDPSDNGSPLSNVTKYWPWLVVAGLGALYLMRPKKQTVVVAGGPSPGRYPSSPNPNDPYSR